MVEINRLQRASDAFVSDLNGLMDQLRKENTKAATLKELQAIIKDPNIVFVVAQDGEKIIGVATLYVMQKIGKSVGHIEDVVVDERYRGQGIGEKLMREVLDIARKRELLSISLTSRPERVAGNKLYQKLGFTIKETNVYRLKL